MIKNCLKCNTEQDVENFYSSKGCYQSYCKPCQNTFAKKWREENKEHLKEYKHKQFKLLSKEDRRRNKYLTRYGIDLNKYNEILLAQGGVCAICLKECQTKKFLSVDHCHITGVVRGLLCDKCNNMLGRSNDDPHVLREGAKYLENSRIAK